jgi:ketosteroid isomerase-like protein
MTRLIPLTALLLTACASTYDADTESAAIIATLNAQDAAWNTGDIPAFMADYVKDDTLRFASGNTVEYGWQTTLERYQRRYPDAAAMGTLSFTDLDVQIIDADDALVFGRWQLERAADRPNGLFTLHMVKRDGRWLIQSDHTSSE